MSEYVRVIEDEEEGIESFEKHWPHPSGQMNTAILHSGNWWRSSVSKTDA
jgi:hypothetical protein